MLGEGLTTAAPVQQMKFDERRLDQPRHLVRRWVFALVALGALATIAVLALQ